jgi:D-arabinitol 2-dehydrogenase
MIKAGVIHMAKSLASEWASHNIRVNSISPGYILTPLTKAIIDTNTCLKAEWESKVPLGRMADPAELAGPIIFMASGAS